MKYQHICSIGMATIMLFALCAAAVSTTVSAADGTISYGPADCYQPNGSWDRVVIVGQTPWYQHSAGAWKSLGGASTGEAAIMSGVNGRTDVFVRGTDGNLWWKYTTNNGATWTSWAKPGGVSNQVLVGTAPAAYTYLSCCARVFWVDANTKALMNRNYLVDTGAWSQLRNLGGICTSTPAVAQTSGDASGSTWHVFVRGTTGALWDRYTTNGGSSWTWKNCGEQLYNGNTDRAATGYGPAAANRDGKNGICDVFWVDNNRALQYKQWDPSTGQFINKKSLGGVCTSPPSAGCNPSQPSLWVEVRGTDNLIHGRTGTLPSYSGTATFQGWSGPYKGPVSGGSIL